MVQVLISFLEEYNKCVELSIQRELDSEFLAGNSYKRTKAVNVPSLNLRNRCVHLAYQTLWANVDNNLHSFQSYRTHC